MQFCTVSSREFLPFARVLAESTAYTNAHHAETAPIVADFTKIPLALFEGGMTRTISVTSLRLDTIQPLIDASAKYKFIPRTFSARDMVYAAPASR